MNINANKFAMENVFKTDVYNVPRWEKDQIRFKVNVSLKLEFMDSFWLFVYTTARFVFCLNKICLPIVLNKSKSIEIRFEIKFGDENTNALCFSISTSHMLPEIWSELSKRRFGANYKTWRPWGKKIRQALTRQWIFGLKYMRSEQNSFLALLLHGLQIMIIWILVEWTSSAFPWERCDLVCYLNHLLHSRLTRSFAVKPHKRDDEPNPLDLQLKIINFNWKHKKY